MEFRVRPPGFMEFFLPDDCCFEKKLHETQVSQSKFHELDTNLTYIYLLLLYNSSILDSEHSLYYIALGSTQTHTGIW